MVMLVLCAACREGCHAEHHEVVQAVPEGMIGGCACPCTGECQGNPEPQPDVFDGEPLALPEGFPAPIAKSQEEPSDV